MTNRLFVLLFVPPYAEHTEAREYIAGQNKYDDNNLVMYLVMFRSSCHMCGVCPTMAFCVEDRSLSPKNASNSQSAKVCTWQGAIPPNTGGDHFPHQVRDSLPGCAHPEPFVMLGAASCGTSQHFVQPCKGGQPAAKKAKPAEGAMRMTSSGCVHEYIFSTNMVQHDRRFATLDSMGLRVTTTSSAVSAPLSCTPLLCCSPGDLG